MTRPAGRPLAPRRARWPLVVAAAVPAAVAMSCSLPTDERVTPYGPDELSPALVETTTTSTSSTTTTTTTVATGSSEPGGATTTSTTPVDTTPVLVFYTVGSTDQVQSLRRTLAAPVPIEQVQALLESSSGLTPLNLRTSVRDGLIQRVRIERATATVTLDEAVLDLMSETEKRRAIAQIVLTLTKFQPPNQGNIGFVVFDVDDEGYPVFVPALGGSSDPGQELSYDDFASLVVGTPSATTTTTTTTTSTTTTSTTSTTPPPTSTAA